MIPQSSEKQAGTDLEATKKRNSRGESERRGLGTRFARSMPVVRGVGYVVG